MRQPLADQDASGHRDESERDTGYEPPALRRHGSSEYAHHPREYPERTAGASALRSFVHPLSERSALLPEEPDLVTHLGDRPRIEIASGWAGKEVCWMSTSSKRQTMAKVNRERALKERRALKQEKKDDRKRAADTLRAEAESSLSAPTVDGTSDRAPED